MVVQEKNLTEVSIIGDDQSDFKIEKALVFLKFQRPATQQRQAEQAEGPGRAGPGQPLVPHAAHGVQGAGLMF